MGGSWWRDGYGADPTPSPVNGDITLCPRRRTTNDPDPIAIADVADASRRFFPGPAWRAITAPSPGGSSTHRRLLRPPRRAITKRRAPLKLYEDRLARGLASVINVLDPDVIVLGGGLSNIECFCENVPALWGRNVFSDTVETRLVGAALCDSSGVHGAASL